MCTMGSVRYSWILRATMIAACGCQLPPPDPPIDFASGSRLAAHYHEISQCA